MSSNANPAMTYQLLGKSSLLISKIGFGCMSLQPTQQDFPFLIDQAIDNGINFFDTADLYDAGQNEINIGKAVRAKRNKLIIATKVGNQRRADGTGIATLPETPVNSWGDLYQ